MNIISLYEEAFEYCGISAASITSQHLASARRTWGLLLKSQQAQHTPLFTLGDRVVTLAALADHFLLTAKEVDITKAMLRDPSGNDRPIRNISYIEWMNIPDKTIVGVPSLIYVNREYVEGEQSKVNIWQQPEDSGYSLVLKTLKYIDDSGGWGESANVPQYWENAIVWDLAERLAYKWAPMRVTALQAKRKEETLHAKTADAPQSEISFTMSRTRRYRRR